MHKEKAMPMGKHVSEVMRAEILRLRAQGLAYGVIAVRTGLSQQTISRICLEARKVARLAGGE